MDGEISKPLPSFKIDKHTDNYRSHNTPHDNAAVLIMRFRNHVKICPIANCDKGQGNKNHRKYGEELHHII